MSHNERQKNKKTRDDDLAIDVEATYRRYGPMVLRRCRRLLKDEEQAVDAMQDTFVQLLRHKERIRDESTSSLLYRMATNVCLNRIRTKTRRKEIPGDELLDRIAASGEPESRLMARLRLDRIFASKDSPGRVSTRTIAVMYLLDGMTLEEVASEVGLSISGVRKRLRQLRSHVQELENV